MAVENHPAIEILAAFVDGSLAAGDLREVKTHLRTCNECVVMAGEAARFKDHDEEANYRWWWTAVAAVAVAALTLLLTQSRRDPLKQLQEAANRSTSARVSFFSYDNAARFRGGRHDASAKELDATTRLQEDARRNPTAMTLHRYGAAQIALAQREAAIATLRRAVALNPRDPSILSDLSAAEYESRQYRAAAETAARALTMNASYAPAAFNYALALSELPDHPAAAAAWKRYLELDSTSGWAAYARKQLGR